MRPRPSPLTDFLRHSPYQGYVYAYPHKTAYRPIAPPIPLRDAWAAEDRRALFLYVHIPFCGMRCGFCNLFTQAKPDDSLVEMFLTALEKQTVETAQALGDFSFSRFAVGGGTPTYLSTSQLDRLFALVEREVGVETDSIPVAVEVSPETVTSEKLDVLMGRSVRRISMGVQSFVESETSNCGRPQKARELDRAIRLLTDAAFPVLNLDLIYGLPGQTESSWDYSLSRTLEANPREIYLYPLYVRPLTGLGRSDKEWDDIRLNLYRRGRDRLRSEGYEQVSMRFFRKPTEGEEAFPRYCCQTDGMVGLGCGARSYTRSLHYSAEYAVGAKGVRDILRGYVSRDDFSTADYGFVLNESEQRRRFLLQSLLQTGGLSRRVFAERFAADPLEEFPELHELESESYLAFDADRVQLTPSGMEMSDAIGPLLFSELVNARMTEYESR